MAVALFPPTAKPIEMLTGRRRAWRVSENEFKVFGRQGDEYRIRVANGLPLCPCEAGIRGQKCWHAALVLARLEREAGRSGGVVAIDIRDVTDPFAGLDGSDPAPPSAARKRCP